MKNNSAFIIISLIYFRPIMRELTLWMLIIQGIELSQQLYASTVKTAFSLNDEKLSYNYICNWCYFYACVTYYNLYLSFRLILICNTNVSYIRFILRNYIAHNAIMQAEKGDYTEVMYVCLCGNVCKLKRLFTML